MITDEMRKDFVDLYILTNKYLQLSYLDFAWCFVRMNRYEINKGYNLELKRRIEIALGL